jgi:putative N-acetylmannosamine-6-phosphate epimerase
MDHREIIKTLTGQLIVSCQDYTGIMISAAIRGGASGLRINSPGDVRLAREITDIPIVACNKMYMPNSPIYITPSIRSAVALVRAGAGIVAFDCTRRKRSKQQPSEIIKAIHDAGALALADMSCATEAESAIRDGADILATTLAPKFDWNFLRELVATGLPVLAEGHIESPAMAKSAIDNGAWSVCVGTAITRPHSITQQFHDALGA